MSSNNYSLPSGYYSSKIITQGRKEGGIRSKSMEDHQNYLPLSIENNKGIYKPKKEYYTGELFNNNNTKQLNYRSSSAERIGGITIVPIRREATLPARRFHSELRTRERNDDNYGYITKQQKTIGNNLYFDSTFDKRKYEERPQTNFDFWRDRYRMEAISEPNTNLTTSYTINYPNGNTTAAEYSSFQQNADNEGGIMKHFQHTKHQQNQREYREWHSGDKQQQQRRSAADSYTTMGTLRNSAEERQSRKAIEYNQKQGEGEHHRHYNGQNYLYYDSGNYKNKNKNEEKWQRNKSSERWYDGRKQREEYIDQRHYRKIRFCCFDIFWPPGGIKQTYYRPSPKQKINKSISQQPSPIPLEHRPFYTYNQSVHPSGHYQTDNNPIYREKGKEFIHNGRQLPTINYSESSREIPVNREHYYK